MLQKKYVGQRFWHDSQAQFLATPELALMLDLNNAAPPVILIYVLQERPPASKQSGISDADEYYCHDVGDVSGEVGVFLFYYFSLFRLC